MIIRENEIFDALEFREGLARAIKGTVRIVSEDERSRTALATGWLITDTLVVTCDYVLALNPTRPKPQYFCHLAPKYSTPVLDRPQEIAADPVQDLLNEDGPPRGARPALLRLRTPAPDCALMLKPENLQAEDMILILHHPMGVPVPRLSIGKVTGTSDLWLQYDASTEGGSGGGAILTPRGFSVAGMHVKAAQTHNEGLSLGAMLAVLQESEVWPEIAEYQKLVDVTRAARSMSVKDREVEPAKDETLLSAALRWSFDPKTIADDKRDQVKLLVNDPSSPRWIMRATERQNLIRSGGDLDYLRKVRDRGLVKNGTDQGQQVIDRILQGPPYKLDEVDSSDLPYWLQAVRWFADVAPNLPTGADVNRVLERRRIKSRLKTTAGDFRGREKELNDLRDWYDDLEAGPMIVSGIGGVGKSALVAQFIRLLPDNPIVLWLDFDRADLAPDDAVSVLTLLSQQLSVQLDDFTGTPVTATSWQDVAKQIGSALVRQPPPLLVLDGFEVAQQVKQHNEIWQVLKLILEMGRDLRILVSGRAPVMNLSLDERSARQIHLTGMDAEDAKDWLRERGINDEDVVQKVVDISDGVPLVLLLALRLHEKVPISDLPKDLPKALIQGFLYERILDRVLDPVLKPIAQDALVLRGLTEAMIPEVLFDKIPEGLTAADVFARLQLEMGLVGDQGDPRALSVLLPGKTNILHLRPELRTATLKLLERDAPQRVRLIDERAVNWYKQQDLSDVGNAAELVYHYLRLGNIAAAEDAWLDSSALLLMYAEEDLPESAEKERAWLRERVSDAETPSLPAWERDVAERIKNAFDRGLLRVVPDLLKEHKERSKDSPLAIYDAWMCWQDNDREGARKALGTIGEVKTPADRDRVVMAALLSASAEDRPAADKLLARIEDEIYWIDRADSATELLAVRAARIRLAVDLKKELALSQEIRGRVDYHFSVSDLQDYITGTDVVLPWLSGILGGGSYEDVSVSVHDVEGVRIRLQRELSRARMWGQGLLTMDQEVSPDGPWRASEGAAAKDRKLEPRELAEDLVVLSWRRWRLAQDHFLSRASTVAVSDQQISSALGLATNSLTLGIAATLSAFRGVPLSIDEGAYKRRSTWLSVDQFLHNLLVTPPNVITPHPLSDERKKLALEVWSEGFPGNSPLQPSDLDAVVQKKFYTLVTAETNLARFVRDAAERHGVKSEIANVPTDRAHIVAAGSEGQVEAFKSELIKVLHGLPIVEITVARDSFPLPFFRKLQPPEVASTFLFLLGPDPLEMLCRRLVGLPDSVP